MTAFKEGVNRLVGHTEKEIAALYGRFAEGRLSREAFIVLAAQVIARARARGVSLADLALATAAMRQVRDVTGPLGLTPPSDDFDRLQQSVTTVLDDKPDYISDREQLRESQRLRMKRVARDAPAEAATWAMGMAMLARGVQGWTRETDPDPCPMCRNLADGVVRSPSVSMHRHTGCACVQRTVF